MRITVFFDELFAWNGFSKGIVRTKRTKIFHGKITYRKHSIAFAQGLNRNYFYTA